MRGWAAAFLLFVACKNPQDPPKRRAAPPDARVVVTTAPPPDAAPLDAPPPDPLAGLIPPGPPRPFGLAAALPLSGTPDDVRRVDPRFLELYADVTDPRWPGVSFRADISTDSGGTRVIEYHGPVVAFPSDVDPLPALEKAWGPGVEISDSFGEPRLVWLNPEDGIRAQLGGGGVQFRRYLPLAAILGDGPEMAIAATPDALRAAHPAPPGVDGPDAWLPETEYNLDALPTVQSTANLGDKLFMYSLYLPYAGNRAVREQILEAFRAKWGAGQATPDGILYVDGPIRIEAHESGDRAFYLTVKEMAMQEEVWRRTSK
jgi:hypothetical protein